MSFMSIIRRSDARVVRPLPIHAYGCRCKTCMPRQSRAIAVANHFAKLTVAGLLLGLFLAWIVDGLVGGPGILFMFGVE